MAQKRMFSLSVVDTDWFLDLPLSAQALYFHLAMRADDDGFVDSPKSIMRKIGSNQNDYDLLVAKRFILIFESGVIVIKHWRLHNTIKNDRYTPTRFQTEMGQLEVRDDKAYTEKESECIQAGTNMETPCLQSVSPGLDIGLDIGLDKDIDNNICSSKRPSESVKCFKNELFNQFWDAYPRKIGKQKCINWWKAHKPDEELTNKMISTIEEYKKREWDGREIQYIPHPYTWLNRGGWDDEIAEDKTYYEDPNCGFTVL